ncbi:LysR family transcriptional regulator [Pseudocitrobacter cyperus]|uniref:LysR family transcriptional regulator n=1 Tax=Pseudocitrobacter cyperus TaxID=3112843 RepID=A0ABV0HM46_9ENTR
MDRVTAARVFNRICELGSLSAASRALGISRPMVSRYLEQMEQWAGARLIHRTSRRLTLTPAGEEILLKTRHLIQLAQEIEQRNQQNEPSGVLRVACAHLTASCIIGPIVADFLARYPAVRLELDVNNHPINLVSERIDVAVRITNNPEPGTIARRLGECRSVLCASPDYLARHGIPQKPADLANHNCLHYSRFAGQNWHFSSAQEGDISVEISGNFSATISTVLLDAAVAGCGIAMVPEMEAREALAQRSVVSLLADYEPARLAIYGMYLSREYQPGGLRPFLDLLEKTLSKP